MLYDNLSLLLYPLYSELKPVLNFQPPVYLTPLFIKFHNFFWPPCLLGSPIDLALASRILCMALSYFCCYFESRHWYFCICQPIINYEYVVLQNQCRVRSSMCIVSANVALGLFQPCSLIIH